MTKSEIRKQIKALVIQNNADLERQSSIVCKTILESPEYCEAKVLFAYIPLPDEVNVLPVISEALKSGKRVAVPKIISGTNKMEFYFINSIENDLKTGSYNILEPVDGLSPANINTCLEKTCVLCPGRAFSKDGKRIGRGKGFYDIHFEKVIKKDNISFCGICFSFQIINDIPTDNYDIKMKKVFSAF